MKMTSVANAAKRYHLHSLVLARTSVGSVVVVVVGKNETHAILGEVSCRGAGWDSIVSVLCAAVIRGGI